jgi:hypothetical protein
MKKVLSLVIVLCMMLALAPGAGANAMALNNESIHAFIDGEWDFKYYANANEVIDTIEILNNMDEWEREEVAALMEYLGTRDVNEAIDKKDNYSIFSDLDQYHDCCDESIDFSGCSDLLERYFDYEAFHRDCDFDIYEASNGVCILN